MNDDRRTGTELLTSAQCGEADRFAIAHGTPGDALMEAAGEGIAGAIMERWSPRPVSVLCGPGNNGGDGFVVARYLRDSGWPVRVALLGDRAKLKGDAKQAADRWDGPVENLSPAVLENAELAVDALFGAGLTRPLEGAAKQVVQAVESRGDLPCVAVDVPSGLDGDSGTVLGVAAACDLTVTFFRAKPGHVLLPGRMLCGERRVVDIGIPDAALGEIDSRTWINGPEIWGDALRWPRLDDHKYKRGHAVVAGGAEMTGAARLASHAALRAGAGMVSVAVPRESFSIYAAALRAGIIAKPVDDHKAFADFIGDPRIAAVLMGPGNGVTLQTRARTQAALATGKPCVLDADALSVFADAPNELFSAIRGSAILTPHDGEYRRLFAFEGDRLTRARAAAAESGAVIVLKGGDTVVAAPDGRAAIAENAPADLATAGSGDVLAGFCVASLAQGLPAFEAAAAAVWLHGEAGTEIGPGLIAEDLPDALPDVLYRLRHALGA